MSQNFVTIKNRLVLAYSLFTHFYERISRQGQDRTAVVAQVQAELGERAETLPVAGLAALVPDKLKREENKKTLLWLVWVLSFFLVAKTVSIGYFLSSLDYTEIDGKRLFAYMGLTILSTLLLGVLTWEVARRPHKVVLIAIGVFSLRPLQHAIVTRDVVSAVASVVTLGLVAWLYWNLYRINDKAAEAAPTLVDKTSQKS